MLSVTNDRLDVLDTTAGECGVVSVMLTALSDRTHSVVVLLLPPHSHTSHPTHPVYTRHICMQMTHLTSKYTHDTSHSSVCK